MVLQARLTMAKGGLGELARAPILVGAAQEALLDAAEMVRSVARRTTGVDWWPHETDDRRTVEWALAIDDPAMR